MARTTVLLCRIYLGLPEMSTGAPIFAIDLRIIHKGVRNY